MTNSRPADPAQANGTSELVCIPVGPLTVVLPDSLAGVIARPPPWPVALFVSRVWIGRRDRQWQLHFGEVEAVPVPPDRSAQVL